MIQMHQQIRKSLVPRYSKVDLENLAQEFLTSHYPKALATPMKVPIRGIAIKKLGLRVLEKCLTEDLSIYGQMCFTSGKLEIYDPENDEYLEIPVRAGTIVIDPLLIKERNQGCYNHTLAHEVFHWWKHKDYHIFHSTRDRKKSESGASNFKQLSFSETELDSDTRWMEFQADSFAARVLMPAEPFTQKFNELTAKKLGTKSNVVSALASFFEVSKQSANIRIDELGLII